MPPVRYRHRLARVVSFDDEALTIKFELTEVPKRVRFDDDRLEVMAVNPDDPSDFPLPHFCIHCGNHVPGLPAGGECRKCLADDQAGEED